MRAAIELHLDKSLTRLQKAPMRAAIELHLDIVFDEITKSTNESCYRITSGYSL